jgi:transposase-like protein
MMLLAIRSYFSRVRCAMTGHTRGARLYGNAPAGFSQFACRRCGATWTRKARKVKA